MAQRNEDDCEEDSDDPVPDYKRRNHTPYITSGVDQTEAATWVRPIASAGLEDSLLIIIEQSANGGEHHQSRNNSSDHSSYENSERHLVEEIRDLVGSIKEGLDIEINGVDLHPVINTACAYTNEEHN